MPRGSKDIVERGKATQFKSGDEAAKKAGRKGGKNSGKTRSMRATMRLLANTPMGPGKRLDLEKLKSMEQLSFDEDSDAPNPNLTVSEIIALKITQGAMEDDPECRRLFLELSGAMAEETTQPGIDDGTDDELSRSLRELGKELESDE